jgi:broad specificity phosphatase PhoE
VLLRHGESTAIVDGLFQGQLDTPLSPAGQRQAELAARRLARPHDSPSLPLPSGAPVEIVHSPLARTTQTAEALARAAASPDAFAKAIPLRADAGFLEVGQGEWEGRPEAEIHEHWGDVLRAWWDRPAETHAPGGESLEDVAARVRPSLTALLRPLAGGVPPAVERSPAPRSGEHPEDKPWSIVVAHDGVLKIVLLTLFDLPLERFWLFPFALCGFAIVDLAHERASLRAHNLTEHLAPLLERRAEQVSASRERSGAL